MTDAVSHENRPLAAGNREKRQSLFPSLAPLARASLRASQGRFTGLISEVAIAVVAFVATYTGLVYLNTPVRTPAFEEVAVQLSGGNAVMVGRYEISYALWRQCHEAGVCEHLPKPGRQDGDDLFPVTRINWLDAGQFIVWINTRTGFDYRLPTLGEWREIAGVPAGETRRKRFDDPRLAWAADYGTTKTYSRGVRQSGHYGFTRSGVADISGNVWEWTSTCVAADPAHCPAYYAAGEDHMAEIPVFLRDAYGGGCSAGTPPANLGLRLLRDL